MAFHIRKKWPIFNLPRPETGSRPDGFQFAVI